MSRFEVTIWGVKFSSNLKWNSHFDQIVKKASKRIYLLYNLVRSGCPTDVLLQAYTCYIRSVLLYNFPVLSNAPSYLKNKLLRTEKRIVRIIGITPISNVFVSASLTLLRGVVNTHCELCSAKDIGCPVINLVWSHLMLAPVPVHIVTHL